MSITITKEHWYTDLAVDMVDANDVFHNTKCSSVSVDNTDTGFHRIRIQARFSLGAVPDAKAARVVLVMRGSVDGQEFESRVSPAQQIEYTGLVSFQQYVLTLTVANPPPYWKLDLYNFTGAILFSTDVNYAGAVQASDVLRRFQFIPAGRLMTVSGDATELVFPLLFYPAGGFGLRGQEIRPQTMVGTLRGLGGVATVVTPFVQVASGGIGRPRGSASGPSAGP